jgi:hypothetical protein
MAASKRAGQPSGKPSHPGVLRAATDELGITTPKEAKRPRRKGPLRVAVYKARKR